MAVRKIVKMDDPLLRKKCKIVTIFDEKLAELLDDMKETMYKFDGMGLAAPQVGVLKRIAVMDVNNMFLELINPEIIKNALDIDNGYEVINLLAVGFEDEKSKVVPKKRKELCSLVKQI